jgi:hypothetical protein
MPPQLSRPVISVDEYLETGETTIPERDTSLPPSVLPLSSTVSSPAIRPLEFGDGSQIAPRWTKRRIHKWKSPLLMSIFFILGVAVSLAHCVFYPKLSGKIVGDSSQQEEKIRYDISSSADAPILRFSDSVLHVPSSLRSVSEQAYGQSIHNGSGEQ